MSTAGALDKSLPVPLYHQLLAVLKANIDTRHWRPDEQLPNETKLAEPLASYIPAPILNLLVNPQQIAGAVVRTTGETVSSVTVSAKAPAAV